MSALDRNIIRNGVALVAVLLIAAVAKPEAIDAALGRAMPTAQAGGPTDPSRYASQPVGAHPYRNINGDAQ